MRFALVAFLAALLATFPVLGQTPAPVVQFIVAPAMPTSAGTIQVFIRVTDPTNGVIVCPEYEQFIDRVDVSGNAILFSVSAIKFPGGFPVPYCDGNTVTVGPLREGEYTMTAAIVFPNGTSPGPFARQQLVVAAAAQGNLAQIPVWDEAGLVLAALAVLLVGAHASRRRV
jgi:hypothetical protein